MFRSISIRHSLNIPRAIPQNTGQQRWTSAPVSAVWKIEHAINARLLYTPCKLFNITSCRCWKLHKLVVLNPEDADNLEVDDAEIGEVNVSPDGLIHPEDPCRCFPLKINIFLTRPHGHRMEQRLNTTSFHLSWLYAR